MMEPKNEMAMDKLNPWQKARQQSGWKTGYIEWFKGDVAYLSVVFSWQLQQAYSRAIWLRQMGYKVRAGGPAVDYDPSFFSGVAVTSGVVDALAQHNPNATFTSRGCNNRCPFCIVPLVEGGLVELDDWPVKPIVCDNNLLACSKKHFDRVIDRLKPLSGVDFNQGLDARLLTPHHAGRLAELETKCIRLAWDCVGLESQFMCAFETLRKAGIPAGQIRVYVLIGFNDTPKDALYRLETVRSLGAWPSPMRYQPLGARVKNSHVASGWTHAELMLYVRYWSNLRRLGAIPFPLFRSGRSERMGRKLKAELMPVIMEGNGRG